MSGVALVVAVLATWRVTHLVVAEDGPRNLVARLRHHAGNGIWGQLMDCFLCASVWVALPVAVWLGREAGWMTWVVLWPAISGGAILLDRALPSHGAAATNFTERE